jgi:hypothetical protein
VFPGGSISPFESSITRLVRSKVMGIGTHNFASNSLELILSGATYISIPGFVEP